MNGKRRFAPIKQWENEGLLTVLDEPSMDAQHVVDWFVRMRDEEGYDFQTICGDGYKMREYLQPKFEEAGFVFSGVSPDNRLMEVVELPEKKFFVAAQYHPELQSRPNRPEELYTAFVTAAIENSK